MSLTPISQSKTTSLEGELSSSKRQRTNRDLQNLLISTQFMSGLPSIIPLASSSSSSLSHSVRYITEDEVKSSDPETKLDLSEKKIGIIALSERLKVLSPSIKSLELENNGLGDEGAMNIGCVLMNSTSLKSISLAHNQIGDGGSEFLARALASTSSLKILNLMWNKISDVGAMKLAKGLKHNGSLTELYLEYNEIGEWKELKRRPLSSKWRTPVKLSKSEKKIRRYIERNKSNIALKEITLFSLLYLKLNMQPESKKRSSPLLSDQHAILDGANISGIRYVSRK